jgi:hypothetical protein
MSLFQLETSDRATLINRCVVVGRDDFAERTEAPESLRARVTLALACGVDAVSIAATGEPPVHGVEIMRTNLTSRLDACAVSLGPHEMRLRNGARPIEKLLVGDVVEPGPIALGPPTPRAVAAQAHLLEVARHPVALFAATKRGSTQGDVRLELRESTRVSVGSIDFVALAPGRVEGG